jgi:hypothetical protein
LAASFDHLNSVPLQHVKRAAIRLINARSVTRSRRQQWRGVSGHVEAEHFSAIAPTG